LPCRALPCLAARDAKVTRAQPHTLSGHTNPLRSRQETPRIRPKSLIRAGYSQNCHRILLK